VNELHELLRATEAAALAASRFVGRGDKNAIDGAAVDAMRGSLANARFDGTVVIGEGEKDDAPMLYHGEHLGLGNERALDVAVDPIDGTTLASKGGAGAISVIAAADRGALFHTRVPYMDKIVVGRSARGCVELDRSAGDNVRAVARALGRAPSEVTVALLDRPRNGEKIASVHAAGARVRLFTDGDVMTAIIALLEERGRVDVLMGIGGAPEGVVTACAVKALGGDMQGRLWLRDDADGELAASEDVDPAAVLRLDDLCRSERTMLVATGVTDGELLDGVRADADRAYTHSLLISSLERTIRVTRTTHATRSYDDYDAIAARDRADVGKQRSRDSRDRREHEDLQRAL
jgi:fructose-1,6-bisphosphatase II